MIALLTILGLGFGIILSGVNYLQGSMTKNYVVSGSVSFSSQAANGEFGTKNTLYPLMDDVRLAEELMGSVLYIMKSEKVLNDAIEDLQMIGITNRDISSNLKVSQYNSTLVIELSLTWRSAEEAIEIMNAVITSAQRQIYALLGTGTLTIVNSPSSRYLVGGSVNAPIWGYMLVLGLAGGIGIAVLEILLRPTLINLRDVETSFGLETIGVIPRDNAYFRSKKSMLVEDDSNVSEIEQRFSAAAYILRNRLGVRSEHHVFYVTSAKGGEGKTTVAANLAIQLSDMEEKVLLVDMNTRNPAVGGLFLEHVDYGRSLNALYRGEAITAEAITTLTGYLDILPMVLEHHPIPMDGTVFDLINSLAPQYDYVILDTAPVGEISDTLSLNEVASTVVFVIGFDSASMQEIRETIDKMDKSGIRVLGCVVNGAQTIGEVNTGGGTQPRQVFDLFSRAPRQTQGRNILEDVQISSEADAMDDDLLPGNKAAEKITLKRPETARKERRKVKPFFPKKKKEQNSQEADGAAASQEEIPEAPEGLSARDRKKRDRDEARRKRAEARAQRDLEREKKRKGKKNEDDASDIPLYPDQGDRESGSSTGLSVPEESTSRAGDLKAETSAGKEPKAAESQPVSQSAALPEGQQVDGNGLSGQAEQSHEKDIKADEENTEALTPRNQSIDSMMEGLISTGEEQRPLSNSEMMDALLKLSMEENADKSLTEGTCFDPDLPAGDEFSFGPDLPAGDGLSFDPDLDYRSLFPEEDFVIPDSGPLPETESDLPKEEDFVIPDSGPLPEAKSDLPKEEDFVIPDSGPLPEAESDLSKEEDFVIPDSGPLPEAKSDLSKEEDFVIPDSGLLPEAESDLPKKESWDWADDGEQNLSLADMVREFVGELELTADENLLKEEEEGTSLLSLMKGYMTQDTEGSEDEPGGF